MLTGRRSLMGLCCLRTLLVMLKCKDSNGEKGQPKFLHGMMMSSAHLIQVQVVQPALFEHEEASGHAPSAPDPPPVGAMHYFFILGLAAIALTTFVSILQNCGDMQK